MRSSLLSLGATHRGAPFAGRRREIGILTHLIEEGLWGRLGLVRVDGPPGMGRRRLIAEALHRGPDAEWIQLAPGGVHADPRLWFRTELLDLLETYPEAPVPSWALHVLARWEPRLRRHAAVPALSAEKLPALATREPVVPLAYQRPAHEGAELVGAAVGAILRALTGRTLVIVDLGLWPDKPSPITRMLTGLCRTLATPGVVALTACAARAPGEVDAEGVRTLSLEPLRRLDLEEMVSAWDPNSDAAPFAGWLHRFTRGHPFTVQEVVRWLEELGHVRVDEDRGRVALIDPLDRLPLPFSLESVMESRYQRLVPEAARLLHLLVQKDDRLSMETLRRLSPDEDEVFEEALAVLRRREFLLRRSFRRPVAVASPLWIPVVEEGVRRMPRLRHRPRSPEPVEERPAPTAPLALVRIRLEEVRRGTMWRMQTRHFGADLAVVRRLVRQRSGPAWSGAKGRLAYLASLAPLRYPLEIPAVGCMGPWPTFPDRPASDRWIRWGLARLSPDVHPGLRRSLNRIRVDNLHRAGRFLETGSILESMRREALAAGHLITASRLKAALAEERRRRGQLDDALRLAEEARVELADRGLLRQARLAGFTAVRALVDGRRLDEAQRRLDRVELAGIHREEIEMRLEALRATPPLPRPGPLDLDAPDRRGWGWGVDDERTERDGQAGLRLALRARDQEERQEMRRRFDQTRSGLKRSGQLTGLADYHEIRLWLSLEDGSEEAAAPHLFAIARILREMQPGERGRRLAAQLRLTPAAGLAVYRQEFQPLLRSLPDPAPKPPPDIRLHLLGQPRVERPDSVWPAGLWPEWWARLWSEAVCRDLLDQPLSLGEVERILVEAGDAPRADPALLLNMSNQLLREEHTVGGGLWLDGDRVRMNWSGIHCDLRHMLERVAAARRAAANGDVTARVLWKQALTAADGLFLPGLHGEAVDAARSFYGDLVREAAEAVFAQTSPEENAGEEGDRRAEILDDPETWVGWLEGAGRVIDLRERLAGLMERSGRRRAASALRRG